MNSRKILNSSFVQVLGFSSTIAIAFFLTPFMIRKLGDHYYGIWVLLFTITSYFALSDFGMTTAVQNHLSVALGKKNIDQFRRIFSNACFLYWGISAGLLSLVAIACVSLIAFEDRFADARLMAEVLSLTGASLAVSFLFYPYGSVLTSHIRFDITAAVGLVQNVLNASITVLLLQSGYGIVALAAGYLAINVLANVVVRVMARRLVANLHFNRQTINRADMASLLGYSGKSFTTQIAEILRYKTGELITAAFISLSQVTHYSIALKLVAICNGFLTRLLAATTPLFAQKVGQEDTARLKEVYFLSLKVATVVACFIYAGLVILGKPFITLWLGPAFQDSYAPLIILGGAVFVAMCQTPSINLFYATNTHQYYAYMSLGEGVATLGFALLFVLQFKMGIAGVALGTLAPVLFTKLLVQPRFVARVLGISLGRYYRSLIQDVLIGSLIYAAFYLCVWKQLLDQASYWYIAAGCLCLLVCSCVHALLIFEAKQKARITNLVSAYFRAHVGEGVR